MARGLQVEVVIPDPWIWSRATKYQWADVIHIRLRLIQLEIANLLIQTLK